MKLLLTLLLGLGLAQEETTVGPTTRGFTVDWQFEEGTTALPTQDPELAAAIIEKQIEADNDPNTKNRKRSKGSSAPPRGPPVRGPPVRGPPVRGPPMRGPPLGRSAFGLQAPTQAPTEAPTEPATTILQTTEAPTTFSAEKPKPVKDAGQFKAEEQQLTSSGLDRSGPRRLGVGGRPMFGGIPGRPGPGDRGLQSPAQLLAEELGLNIGEKRRCWICKNAKSNSECLQKGTYQTCRKNESCQTETRWENGFLKINSQCKQRNACTVATKQTKQCDGMKGRSGRTCWRCCHHDLCNLDDIDPKNY